MTVLGNKQIGCVRKVETASEPADLPVVGAWAMFEYHDFRWRLRQLRPLAPKDWWDT